MADRKRILIVDDDQDLVELLRDDLKHRGYEVAAAANGQEALKIAKTQSFDLLLLDIMLPKGDGHQVANAIKTYWLSLNEDPTLLGTGTYGK